MLTQLACKNAQPKEKPYKIFDEAGLYLLITPNGSKLWKYKFKIFGKEKLMSFGKFPDVALVDAREMHRDARLLKMKSINPIEVKRTALLQGRMAAANTVETVALEWHRKQSMKWSPRYSAGVLKRLQRDVLPYLGKLPISELTAQHIKSVIIPVQDRGAKDIARRVLGDLSNICVFAAADGKRVGNPADGMISLLDPIVRGNFASIKPDAIPEFISRLSAYQNKLRPHTVRAVQLLMLLFVRPSELVEAPWSEFNLDEAQWIIPAERMKKRKEHIVPLSSQALKILRDQHKETGHLRWVFPNSVRPTKTMTNNTILIALKRMGYKGIHTAHGFRSLAMSTLLERLNYKYDLVDLQLSHVRPNQNARAYNRAEMLVERKEMMQKWGDYLQKIAEKCRSEIKGI